MYNILSRILCQFICIFKVKVFNVPLYEHSKCLTDYDVTKNRHFYCVPLYSMSSVSYAI